MRICPAHDDAIDDAARALRAGRLVAFPTETVYGLGADATDPAALAQVFAAKGRPADHPLIVHIEAAEQLDRWAAEVCDDAYRLAAAFWPGPLTLVLHRGAGISDAATGGRQSVGLRVPDHPVAIELLRRTGRPVAAPSANRFGRVSPTTAADVAAEFADLDDDRAPELILDGGACRIGVESTIVELLGDSPTLLRPGGVPVEFIEEVLGRPVAAAHGPARASGMLASHYAPRVAVDLVEPEELEALIAEHLRAGRRVAVLGVDDERLARLPASVLALGPVGDTAGYARLLYRRLREADEAQLDRLVALRPAAIGLGHAVRDRLQKAAAPRP